MAKKYHINVQKIPQGNEQNGGSIQILQLSLFMMLLAFFIVLTITSNYEITRVQPVLQSLYKAFYSEHAPRVKTEVKEQMPVDEITTYLEREQAIEYLTRLFKAELPSVSTTTNGDLGVMQAYFDRGSFETQIKSRNSAVLDKIIAALIFLDTTEKPYSVEITLSGRTTDQTRLVNKINQLEDYALILSRRGVPPHLISLSMAEPLKEDIVLTFKPYTAYAPQAVSADGE